MYRKLKRVWSHGYVKYIPNFKKVFPELKKLSSDELCDRFIELNLDFYSEELTPVPFYIRLTLPFAILTMFIMIIGIPIIFFITGEWNYSFSEKNRLLNWFRSLKLL
jgi:hypothetical protein